MSGPLRQVKLTVEGQGEADGSVTLLFTLRGVVSNSEARDVIEYVAPKLERAVMRVLQRRGCNVYEKQRGEV